MFLTPKKAMDPQKIKALEDAVNNSRPFMARRFEPRLPLMSAGYIRENTVEPLDCKVIGDCTYTVSIKHDRAWGTLVVSLFERETNSGFSKKAASVQIPLIAQWNVVRVNAVTALMEEAYRRTDCAFRSSPVEKGVLKQLIVGRILYYKSGGSAQNNRN